VILVLPEQIVQLLDLKVRLVIQVHKEQLVILDHKVLLELLELLELLDRA
jgi:hypothetical protein